jgi:hypothetical protein
MTVTPHHLTFIFDSFNMCLFCQTTEKLRGIKTAKGMDLWFTCIWLVQVFCIHTCCYVLYCAKDCLSAVSECLLILFIFYWFFQSKSGHRHDEDVDFPPMEKSQKIDLVPFEKHKTRCTFKMNCKTKRDSNFRNLQNIRTSILHTCMLLCFILC